MIWFELNQRIVEVFDQHAKQSTRLAFVCLMLAMFLNVLLVCVHIICYTYEYVFFPNEYFSYMIISWLFCCLNMMYNIFRNFELMKSEYAMMVSEITRNIIYNVELIALCSWFGNRIDWKQIGSLLEVSRMKSELR